MRCAARPVIAGAADTVPSPDSLQAAGQVLLDEFWDVYKALLR